MIGLRIAGPLVLALLLALPGCTRDLPLSPLPPLDDLPADLSEVTLVVEGRATVPYIVLELNHPTGFRGFVVVNREGQPVWYFRTQGGPLSFTRRQNGNFVFLDTQRGLVEVNPAGQVIRELAQEARPGRRMHHDVMVSERNTVLFLAEDWQPWQGELVNGEAIWEWSPESGSVVKLWSAFDHLSPALDWGPRSVNGDWLHANSISRGQRGNILVSLHFLNQVISIAPDFGAIEWRLGGTRSTITVDDPFSGQHTAAEIAPGRILMFDNGFERSEERYSRAIEFEITGSTARRVWQWRPPIDNWARVISGVRVLPSSNRLVTFGVPENQPPGSTGPIEVYEITRDGRIVWHLRVGGRVGSMYRATPLERI